MAVCPDSDRSFRCGIFRARPDDKVEACCCNLAINIFFGLDQIILCLGIVVECRSAMAHLHSLRVVER